MLINHRTVQLGVVNQKRPEIWQSFLPPLTHTVDTVSVAIDTSDYKLRTVAHDHTLEWKLFPIRFPFSRNQKPIMPQLPSRLWL